MNDWTSLNKYSKRKKGKGGEEVYMLHFILSPFQCNIQVHVAGRRNASHLLHQSFCIFSPKTFSMHFSRIVVTGSKAHFHFLFYLLFRYCQVAKKMLNSNLAALARNSHFSHKGEIILMLLLFLTPEGNVCCCCKPPHSIKNRWYFWNPVCPEAYKNILKFYLEPTLWKSLPQGTVSGLFLYKVCFWFCTTSLLGL